VCEGSGAGKGCRGKTQLIGLGKGLWYNSVRKKKKYMRNGEKQNRKVRQGIEAAKSEVWVVVLFFWGEGVAGVINDQVNAGDAERKGNSESQEYAVYSPVRQLLARAGGLVKRNYKKWGGEGESHWLYYRTRGRLEKVGGGMCRM